MAMETKKTNSGQIGQTKMSFQTPSPLSMCSGNPAENSGRKDRRTNLSGHFVPPNLSFLFPVFLP